MAEPITMQKLTDASIDADTLGEFANEDKLVTSRLGLEYPSAPMASRLTVENGLLGATPFSTYTAMAASELADEAYAVVTTDDDVNKNGVYQKINGAWELSPYNPAIQILNKILELDAGYNQVIHDSEGNKYSFAIVNELLKSIAWGMSDTKMLAPNHELLFGDAVSGFGDSAGRMAIRVTKNGGIELAGMELQATSDGAVNFNDRFGRTALRISPDGKVNIFNLAGIAEQNIRIDKLEKTKGTLRLGWNRKDINHVIIYGQSLAEGSFASGSEPNYGNEISLTQPYSNVMLAGGVGTEYQQTALYIDNAFAPLIEKSIGQKSDSSDVSTYQQSQNETPVSGTCNEFTRRCLANTMQATSDDFVMAGMTAGRGGYSVENLTYKDQFNVLKHQIIDIANTAKAMGKTEAVAAICWIQGEANHQAYQRKGYAFDDEITADTYEYMRRLEYLISQIDKVIIDNCIDQDFTPYVFTYQTEGHRGYTYKDVGGIVCEDTVASAQWFLSKNNERVSLAVPVYALAKNDRDNIHLTHVGSWLLGAYMARAMEHTMHRRLGKWRPLEPTHWDWQDTHCDINFHVPVGKLVFDTYFCPQQPNQGFDIWIDKTLQASAISSVSLLDDKTVRVSFSAVQPNTARLTYCLGRDDTAPRAMGNLRDTHGDSDIVTDPLGTTHNLHNPSVMFNIHKTRGFI